jgi:hypothetical protein
MTYEEPLFKRDGSCRDLEKLLLEFLKPVPTPSEKYNLFEENQYLFLKTLGEDFSQHSLLYPKSHPKLTERITSMKLEKNCHGTAEELFVDHDGDFELIWGLIDSYTDEAYDGTYVHSFLKDKHTSSIIDPWLIKRINSGKLKGLTQNHFGVILPFEVLLSLNLTGIHTWLNFSGTLQQIIFSSKTETERVINEVLKYK